MDKTKLYAMVSLVVVVALVVIYGATAKATTITKDPLTGETHGGIGNFLSCLINPASCVKK